MIIWLASYPKSGNTLVRSMLASFFFSKNGIYNQHIIQNIKTFPNIHIFENLGINIKYNDEVIKNYIKVQESLNIKTSIQFFKTHSCLFNFYNKYPFTDLNNSLGVIYIVRDPRNVVTSFSKFTSLSIKESSEYMINKLSIGGNLNAPKGSSDRTRIFTGTWASNFQTWKSFQYQERYLLIKYEDLINDPEKIFLKILKFIYKLKKSNFEYNKEKLKNVLNSTTFDNMKSLEKKEGFKEAKIDKDGKPIPFFNLGKKNDWRNYLDNKLIKKIETKFEKEMLELNYL